MSLDVRAWRGVATDEDAERTAAEGTDKASVVRLQASSRRLLGSLLRPHRRLLWFAVILLLTQNAAGMAGPYLVKLGIDRGIPPLTRSNDVMSGGVSTRIGAGANGDGLPSPLAHGRHDRGGRLLGGEDEAATGGRRRVR